MSSAIQNASYEDSDQTARMRRMILIIALRTRPKIRFLTLLFFLLIPEQRESLPLINFSGIVLSCFISI